MKDTKENRHSKLSDILTPERVKAAALLFILSAATALIISGSGMVSAQFIGSFVICCIMLSILYRDILRYKPAYVEKFGMLILLGMTITGTLFAGWVSTFVSGAFVRGLGISAGDSMIYGMPLPAGAMLVTLLFDFHTAIVFSFTISLLAGVWQSSSLFAFYVFVGSLVAAFSIIRCKKRTAIVKAGGYVLVSNVITSATLLLFKESIGSTTAPLYFSFSVFSALSVIAIVSLSLPVLEYLFKVSTDISLLELMDLEHPLMKNLMVAAPGTYHHSIIVGNLVEACSEDIGVNPLLARAGAYYHDIGKLKMPEYFIENQAAGVNKHESLTPHMSSMILISHVKEGVDLAVDHKLPETVCNIIQQHHGTSLITYFYEKAKSISNDPELPDSEYKYPGPRPQSRVSAIIMMADAVEAASRVLSDPNPARIGALVDRIINHIYLDGQLDDCELTLKDIQAIKKRFTYILTGILHKRIDYPGFEFNNKGGNGGHNKQQAKDAKDKQSNGKERLLAGADVSGA